MKLLYIHQYFKTPEEGGCTRSYHLAKGLTDHGHEVEMITAHNRHYDVKEIAGFSVRYLPVPYGNEFGFKNRVIAFLKFVRLAKREAKKIQGVDLAYVMTTPLTTGLIATWLKKKRSIPYIFEVGDLWPEAPVQMRVIKNPILKNLLYGLEKRFYQRAEKIVALSPDIRHYILEVVPTKQVLVLPNLSHCNYYTPNKPKTVFGKESPFQIGYIGTIGRANHLEYLIEGAKRSHEHNVPIHFHIMGEGAELANIKQLAKPGDNITIHRFGSKGKVKALLEDMDAIYISFLNVPILGTGSPNKFYDGLAAGKLIIINFEGWIRQLIDEKACGFSYDPENPEDFIRRVRPYLTDQKLLKSAQTNSRKLAEQSFDKDLLVKKLITIIEN